MASLGKQQWADSEHIVFVNKTPYYQVKGNSYCDVYKNGLSLDELCIMLPCDFKPTKNSNGTTHIIHSVVSDTLTQHNRVSHTQVDYLDMYDTQHVKRRIPKSRRNRKLGGNKFVKKTYRMKGNDYKQSALVFDSNIHEFDILEKDLNREKIAKKQDLEFEFRFNTIYNVFDELYDAYDDKWLDPDMWPSSDDW